MASFWTAVSRGQALLDLVRSRTEVARAPEDPRTRGWYVVAIPDGDLNALPLRMSWALWCLVTIVLFHRVWPDAKLTGLRMALSANHRWHISRRQRLQSFALLRTSSLHSSRRAPFQSSPPYLSPPCHQVQTSVRRLGSAGSWLKLRGWITGHRGLLQMQQVVVGPVQPDGSGNTLPAMEGRPSLCTTPGGPTASFKLQTTVFSSTSPYARHWNWRSSMISSILESLLLWNPCAVASKCYSTGGTVADESRYFLDVDPTRGNLCVCPALNT